MGNEQSNLNKLFEATNHLAQAAIIAHEVAQDVIPTVRTMIPIVQTVVPVLWTELQNQSNRLKRRRVDPASPPNPLDGMPDLPPPFEVKEGRSEIKQIGTSQNNNTFWIQLFTDKDLMPLILCQISIVDFFNMRKTWKFFDRFIQPVSYHLPKKMIIDEEDKDSDLWLKSILFTFLSNYLKDSCFLFKCEQEIGAWHFDHPDDFSIRVQIDSLVRISLDGTFSSDKVPGVVEMGETAGQFFSLHKPVRMDLDIMWTKYKEIILDHPKFLFDTVFTVHKMIRNRMMEIDSLWTK